MKEHDWWQYETGKAITLTWRGWTIWGDKVQNQYQLQHLVSNWGRFFFFGVYNSIAKAKAIAEKEEQTLNLVKDRKEKTNV